MKEINDVLANWGRWARNKYHKQHCASMEHRYRSPQEWGDWENMAPGQMSPPIDILDAIKVQKILSRMAVASHSVGSEVGSQYAWALTFKHCYPKYDRWAAARICKVYRPERLLKLMSRAEHAVANHYYSTTDMAYIEGCNSERAPISIAQQGNHCQRQGRVFLKAA